ncbi:hypothetical protein D3C79_885420 [compost metagenome]
MLYIAQIGFRHVAHGLVEFAVGMAELFFSIDNQDIAHLSRLLSELKSMMSSAPEGGKHFADRECNAWQCK